MKIIDTSTELQVYRYHNGIKTLNPLGRNEQRNANVGQATGYTISNILAFQCSVYFLNSDSITQNRNELSAAAIGFSSARSSIGKSIVAVTTKETANRMISDDKYVMRTNSIMIMEHSVTRQDDIAVQFLTIKSPWYGDNNTIIGVFGCSVALGKHSISKSLAHIAAMGLLTPHIKNNNYFLGSQIDNVYLSARESEILKYMARGRTAKGVAKLIGLSHRTVEQHIEKIKFKMNVSTKAELIEKVIDKFI